MKALVLALIFLLLPSCPVSADIYSVARDNSPAAIENAAKVVPGFSFEETVRSMEAGDGGFKIRNIYKSIVNFLFSEIRLSLATLARVVILGVLCGILSSLHIGSSAEGLKSVTFFVSYVAIAGLAAKSLAQIANAGGRVIEDLVNFTNAAVPAMGSLLIASGSPSVFAALSPSMLLAAGAAGTLIKTVGLPSVYMSLALCLVSHITEKYSVGRLARLIKNTAFWVICASLTIFTALTGVVGFAAGSIDGVAAKTAKFALSSAVPVLGSILSDSIEAVAGSAIILKNAAGSAGILFIIVSVLYPLVKIIASAFIYRLAAAVLQPVTDKRIVDALSDMADVMSALAGMIAAAGAAMIIALGMLINASNMGAMLR